MNHNINFLLDTGCVRNFRNFPLKFYNNRTVLHISRAFILFKKCIFYISFRKYLTHPVVVISLLLYLLFILFQNTTKCLAFPRNYIFKEKFEPFWNWLETFLKFLQRIHVNNTISNNEKYMIYFLFTIRWMTIENWRHVP